MFNTIMECVPNFSEGRDHITMPYIADDEVIAEAMKEIKK